MRYDSALPKSCLVALLVAVAGCQQAGPGSRDDSVSFERIDLDALIERTSAPQTGLPDATDSDWELTPNGKTLRFANPAGEPLLTIACEVPAKAEPRLRFTHYASAPPDAKALFAMVGNMRVARINMDAREQNARWLWNGTEPAEAQKLEALMGTNEVVATMPGGGEIKLKGSTLPRDFIKACRDKAKPKVNPLPVPTTSPAGPA